MTVTQAQKIEPATTGTTTESDLVKGATESGPSSAMPARQ